MKAFVLITSVIVSVSASALPIQNPNGIIDPPRIQASLRIVTPNGPAGPAQPSEPEQPFPGQAKLSAEDQVPNFLDSDEFDVAAPEAEAILQQYDRYYEAMTGESAYPTGATVDRGDIDPAVNALLGNPLLQLTGGGCVRQGCAVWAHVNKRTQTVTIMVNGSYINLPNSRVSTSLPGQPTKKGFTSETPNFDKHPDGRIYTRYTSKAYPGGDYQGLGNMPYAVFIRGPYAMHGTASIAKLGRKASHGCIRMHPATGKLFNGLVRQYGVSNTWITVD
jgi:hypothetical protein